MMTKPQAEPAATAVQVGDTWYRYEDRRYGSFDEFGSRTYVYVRVEERTYEVAKVTPKGVWLDFGWQRRFVRHDARKKFAAPTREEAMASFLARKERHARILRAQLEQVEDALAIARKQQDEAHRAIPRGQSANQDEETDMSLQQAFGITEDDVATVLCANEEMLSRRGNRTLEEYADEIFGDLEADDFDRIAKAALDASVELDEQTIAAHEELRCILVENGTLAG